MNAVLDWGDCYVKSRMYRLGQILQRNPKVTDSRLISSVLSEASAQFKRFNSYRCRKGMCCFQSQHPASTLVRLEPNGEQSSACFFQLGFSTRYSQNRSENRLLFHNRELKAGDQVCPWRICIDWLSEKESTYQIDTKTENE